MSQEALRVVFRVEMGNGRPAPKPEPGATRERLRQDRAARRARSLALAYYIDDLVRSGQVTGLAEMAQICGVSRAAVSKIRIDMKLPIDSQAQVLLRCRPRKRYNLPTINGLDNTGEKSKARPESDEFL